MLSFVTVIVLGVVGKKSEQEDNADVEKSIIVEVMSLKEPNLTQILNHGNLSSIGDTHFDSTLPTRLFIHGFQSKGEMKKHLVRGMCCCSKLNSECIEKAIFEKISCSLRKKVQIYQVSSRLPYFTAYFHDGKHNINLIAINWEKAASSIDYFTVKRRVNVIGIFTAKLIDSLVEHKIIKLKDLSVIGFSLGAHAAGIGKQ